MSIVLLFELPTTSIKALIENFSFLFLVRSVFFLLSLSYACNYII